MAQSDFNVLYRNETPLWTPECPIRFQAVQVSGSPTGTVRYLQTRIQNISAGTVDEIVYEVTSEGSNEKMTFTETQMALRPGESRALTPRELTSSMGNRVNVLATRIEGRGANWTGRVGPIEIPKPKPLHLSENARAERMKILHEEGLRAEIQPNGAMDDHGGWWVCSCGQLNVGREHCINCYVTKEEYLRLEDEKMLEEQWQKDQEQQQEEAERKKQARKKGLRYTIIACIVVAVIAVGVSIYNVFIVPEVERQELYDDAMQYLQNGQYDRAIRGFEDLDGYRDSEEQIQKARDLEEETRHADIIERFEQNSELSENPILRYVNALGLHDRYGSEPGTVEYVTQARTELPEYPYLKLGLLDELGLKGIEDFLGEYGIFEVEQYSFSSGDLQIDNTELPDGMNIVLGNGLGLKPSIMYYLSDGLSATFFATSPMNNEDTVRALVPICGFNEISHTQDVTRYGTGQVVGYLAEGDIEISGKMRHWSISVTDNRGNWLSDKFDADVRTVDIDLE